MRREVLILFVTGGLLAGCVGPQVPIQSPEQAGGAAFEAADRVRVIAGDQTRGMQLLGPVEGYSCKNKIWDPAATADAAALQLKVAAARRGATAVASLTCEESGTSLSTNCWQSFRCQAQAYR